MLPSLQEINYYPNTEDPEFYRKLYNKAEFSLSPNKVSLSSAKNVYQIEPHQLFVKNFLSPVSRYNGLLLFFDTGSGKTCASLQIAEQMRPYISEKGGRIIILGTSKDHVKKIFEREMYDVNKEIREMSNKLPPGASHCLGDTYLSGDSTRLIDDHSFSINVKHAKATTGNIYEFYGFQQFHTRIAQLEANGQFLNEYFANCIFIVDEAHNLSGLEQETDEDETVGATSQDDDLTLKAEQLRHQIIDLKRQMMQNLFSSQKLLEDLQIDIENQTGIISKITDLKQLNRQLDEKYQEMKGHLVDILHRQKIVDETISDWLYSKVGEGGDFRLDELYGLDGLDFTPEQVQELDQNKIINFLRKIESTSAFRNEYPSFLREIKSGKGSKDDGLKAYQAIKKVLLSLGGSKVILLSATPMRDRPDSIVNLINILRINDGKRELPTNVLFEQGQRVNQEALERAVTGYVSRYRVDPSKFPVVIWNLADHPNVEDRSLLNLKPSCARLPIEPFTLRLGTSHKHSPKIALIGCRSKSGSPQNLDYLRYIQYLEQQSSRKTKAPVQLLETRCNFGYPLEVNQITDLEKFSSDEDYLIGVNSNGESVKYLMRYTMENFFSQIMEFDSKGSLVSNFRYLDEKRTGRFLDLDQIGNYSSKLATLVDMLNAVAVRDGEPGGLNLIYSKSTWFGSYLIALTLENLGYRRYPRGSLWQKTPDVKRCCKCNKLDSEHIPGGKCTFKQAYYLLAVGSSDEVTKYMSVLTNLNNSHGELIKVVVGTKTITEGLDFKFIRYIHVFEPWYNFTRLDQLAGRGSRKGSHLDLPKFTGLNEYQWRNVTMLLYCYLHSETNVKECLREVQGSSEDSEEICNRTKYNSKCMFTKDISNYLITLEKDCKIKQVERILSRQAVDCPLYLDTTPPSPDEEYTRKCYYNSCGMGCPYLPPALYLVKNSSQSLTLEWNGKDGLHQVNLETTDQSLESLGILSPIIGVKSGRSYLISKPFLPQLKMYGDWKESNVSDERQMVAWMIDKKDYSTFYMLFYETIAKQLVRLLQHVLVSDYGELQPIIRLSDLTQRIQSILSFNLEPSILAGLVDYAMGLMSGVYRPRKYAISDFIIIPLTIASVDKSTIPNDTYYILHPDDIQTVDSSIYHKYVWPKTVQRGRKEIDISKWTLPTPPRILSSITLVQEPQSTFTGVASEELIDILKDYFAFMNDNPYNKYEMYVHFMKEYRFRDTVKFGTALTDPYYKPSYILHQLIINQFDPNYVYIPWRTRLIRYLVHYLEYQSITQVLVCDCQNVRHRQLNTQEGVNFRFLFENRVLQTGKLDVVITNSDNVQFQPSSAYTIQTYQELRTASPIAVGDIHHPRAHTELYMRIDNKLARTAQLKNPTIKNKGFHQNCHTGFVSKGNDLESMARPGLMTAYNELAKRAQDIIQLVNPPNVAPPFYHVGLYNGQSGIAYYVFALGKDGNAMTDQVLATDKHEKTFKSQILCPLIALLLHYLSDYDPHYFYFDYTIPIAKTAGTTTTKTEAKRKGRKKKE